MMVQVVKFTRTQGRRPPVKVGHYHARTSVGNSTSELTQFWSEPLQVANGHSQALSKEFAAKSSCLLSDEIFNVRCQREEGTPLEPPPKRGVAIKRLLRRTAGEIHNKISGGFEERRCSALENPPCISSKGTRSNRHKQICARSIKTWPPSQAKVAATKSVGPTCATSYGGTAGLGDLPSTVCA